MKKRMISVVLSLVLLASFVSCRYNESQQRIYDAAHNAGAHSANENVSEFESGVKDLLTKYQGTQETDAETALLSRSVFFSPEDLAAMKVTVNNLSFTYPYANLSDVESAYKRYQTLPSYQGTALHGLATDLPLDTELLFEIVKANNAAYVESNSILKRFQLEDDYVLWACEIICDIVNRELPALGFSAMLADVDANLADLKISKSPGAALNNGTITDDNCMYLNPIMLDNMIDLYGEHADDETVAHETEHIIQKLSPRRAQN